MIIDGISEMISVPETPITKDPEFSISSLIVTSRTDGIWSEASHTDVRPLRIDSDHLSPFLNAYLGSKHRMADTDLFEACRRLAAMVGTRSITPLLARMYAEQLIGAHAATRRLPDNVPQLVLGYITALNRERTPEDPQHGKVHRAAEIAAWECCRRTLSAGFANRDEISNALASCDMPVDLLDYLEKKLQLVRTVPPAHTDLEFLQDPLAEYLAAMRLIQICRSNEDWVAFIRVLDEIDKKSESTADFVAAVWDCCNNTPLHSFGGSPDVLRDLERRSQRTKQPALAAHNP